MEANRLKMKVISHSKQNGHIVYLISIEKDGKTFQISDRYSNLKSLHDNLKKELGNSAIAFPEFPPKKFFKSEDEKFLKKRQEELNKYFAELLNNEELSSLNALKKYIEDSFKKENLNINLNNSNSQQEKQENLQTKQILSVNQNSPLPPSSSTSTSTSASIKHSVQNVFQKKTNEEILKMIKEVKEKLLDLGFFSEPEINEDNELKYNTLFNTENILNNDTIKDTLYLNDIVPGDDNNFQLIGLSDENLSNTEKDIKDKIEKIFIQDKDIDKVYDTNGLIVPV